MDGEFPAPPSSYMEPAETSLASRFIKGLGLFSAPATSNPSTIAPASVAIARSVSSKSALSSSEPISSLPIPFPTRRTTIPKLETTGPPAPMLLSRRPTRLSQATINEDIVQSSARSISEYGSPVMGDSFQAMMNLSSIPGFPLKEADDARSIRSSFSSTVTRPSASVSHIFRRIRGEGLSKTYWVDDSTTSHCFDCQSVFSTFRRKHHCRICGQVFCGRCASNLIPSAKFGSSGVVRVCNLCLSIMDRRENDTQLPPNIASARFRPAHRETGSLSISSPLQASARPPQSEFAASHLFPRTDTGYTLYSDAGDVPSRISEASDSPRGSPRAGTPDENDQDSPRSAGSPLFPAITLSTQTGTTAIAPFRALVEDEIKQEGEGLGITEQEVVGPRIEVENIELATGLEAPMSSPNLENQPNLILPILSEALSFPPGPFDAKNLSPIMVQRGRSNSISQPALDEFRAQIFAHPTDGTGFNLFDIPHTAGVDPRDLHRILAASGPYQELSSGVDLSFATTEHIRKMLKQSLKREGVPLPKAWENQLYNLLSDVISLVPNIKEGDNLDIRRYVRIKKLPGGLPKDSEYVEGVVCTKNILHKQMARSLDNPRIMLLSFPLEYQRVESQLMSLEPLLKQEREYLKNLVARIVAQRPHVVLVERNVSRLALEYLMEANVAVARNVKPEVIRAVSRATQADIISSMDKLALKPRLGRCDKFKVQTFVHSMIPGKRKTFLRFEGCSKELGCTLILRGASIEVLKKIKSILNVMIPIAYSAKLEGFLLRDELVVPVVINPSRRPSFAEPAPEDSNDTIVIKSDAVREQERTSQEIAKSLLPYQAVILSGSPYVRFPAPYPLARTKEEDTRVTALRRLREFEETEKIIFEEEVSRKEASEISTSASAVDSISETFSEASLDDLTSDNLLVPPISSRDRTPTNALDVIKMIEKQQDIAHASEYDEAEAQYAAQLSNWQSYLAQHKDSMDVKDHDRLFVLETFACTQTDRLCSPPIVRAIRFYGPEDVALGQYIDGVCRDAGKACSEKACERPMLVHYKTWVHGRYRVMIIPEFHVVDLQSPELEGQIVMWSWCKICRLGSPQAAMSEETYRFSFAKYLELCFYPQDFVRRDKSCEHNSHTDHVRFWMVNNRITFQITVDSVEIRNIIAPPLVLKTKPEKQVQLRNEEYLSILSKSTAFWDSIAFRIASFNYDVVQPEQLEACRTEMEDFSTKCDTDRRTILRLLSKTYEEVQTTNTIVMTTLQNLAVSWEHEWTAFEQRIIPAGEREGGRRLNAVQLKRLFSDNSITVSPDRRSTSVGIKSTFSETSSIASCSPPEFTTANLLDTITATTFDHDSDSTVYGLPTLPAPFVDQVLPTVDTSGGESDIGAIAIPQPTRRKQGGVANLVKLFSDPALVPAIPSSSRAVPRRSVPDSPRAPKQVEISSYASTVGVAHLATSTSKSSRIPLRTATTVTTRRPVGSYGRGSRSTSVSRSTSRSVSRAGSIRDVPISAHKAAADGSNVTLKAKSTNVSTQSSRSTLKGAAVAQDSEGSDMPPTRTPKKIAGKGLGVARPTASSSNKAVNRRVVSANTRSVSHLTHHFNEKARQQRVASFRGRRARPIVEPRTAILVFDNVKDAVREDSDSEDGQSSDGSSGADDEYENEHDHGSTFQQELTHHRSENTPRKASEESFLYEESVALQSQLPEAGPSVIHVRSNNIEILPLPAEAMDSDSVPTISQSPRFPDTSTFPRLSEGESSGNERGSIMKALQTFWAYRGADFTPLEWPLRATEHLFADNPILVREDEPSSILAFTLSSKAYRDKLRESDGAPRVTETSEPFMPDELHAADRSGTWDVLDFQPGEGIDLEETLRNKPAKHFRLQFEEGTTSFFCKIFFAEQFDALRHNCGCADQFVESLARCVKWDSSGGKSKVDFLKTKDDRFIIKEISRLEMDALLKFAPAYFEYMSKAFFHGLPTILAKIFGFYRIGLRNPATGKVLRLDVLVTENLFYERQLEQVFDLKGSTRNRHVQVSNKPNEVLMDENLVELSYKNPLYVREGSKRFIKAAVFNDSLFLANLNVMDYSLVVGVDSSKQELVVGIVDFIRTYTWDKKLESWVKDSAFLGGGSSKPGGPTIVTPKQYKTRFREAMNGYFLLAPDSWLSPTSLPQKEEKEPVAAEVMKERY